MRNILLILTALVALVSSPRALSNDSTEPPIAKLGQIINSQPIDALTVFNVHEDGVSLAKLDVQTMEVQFSMFAAGDPPALKTTWTDQNGQSHTVETPIGSSNPSDRMIAAAIALHQRLVNAMQQIYPPI